MTYTLIIIIFHTVQDTFSVYCVPGSTPVPQNPMNAMVMVMVKLILNATSPYPSPLHPHPSPLMPFPHPSYPRPPPSPPPPPPPPPPHEPLKRGYGPDTPPPFTPPPPPSPCDICWPAKRCVSRLVSSMATRAYYVTPPPTRPPPHPPPPLPPPPPFPPP